MKEVEEAARQEMNADQKEALDFATAIKTVGSIVEFGTYEQDNNQSNGTEPIEWIVLDVQDGKSLLISRYGLDSMPYHRHGPIYWKLCSLRSWLYNEFPTLAFTEAEQKSILITTVDNGAKQRLSEPGSGGEPDSQERAFLLGYDEAEKYFSSAQARQCEPTAYASARGAHVDDDGACSWWLRTPGYTRSADFILPDGTVGSQDTLSQSDVTVRPAIWVSHEENTAGRESAEAERFRLMQEKWGFLIGTQVSFGSYEQDNSLANGPEPIEWNVLDVQDEKALLISKRCLDSVCYDSNASLNDLTWWGSHSQITWERSTLRQWLNEEFLGSAFTEQEQALIVRTSVDNSSAQGDPEYQQISSNSTYDTIYLLSYAELLKYFPVDKERACEPGSGVLASGLAIDETENTCRWWLRTPVGIDRHVIDYAHDRALYVDSDGSSGSMSVQTILAIRPVIWVDLKALESLIVDEIIQGMHF